MSALEIRRGGRWLSLGEDEAAGDPDWQLWATQAEHEPILKYNTERDGNTLSFFATLTKFSTPYDVTLQELIVESLFPADEKTRLLFNHSFGYSLE
ncbi:MAG: hypothetical protein KDJ52_32825 [Anaerolineae bacterium]|nr:hypothetical protein [Anaerolineae bacterium]